MGLWSFVKKDLGYFKTIAKTEQRFHKRLWIMLFPDGLVPSMGPVMRRPLSQYDGTLREKRLRQEKEVLTAMIVLWAALTTYLIFSRNWEGFAVWLIFAALVARSLVIIRVLNKDSHPAEDSHPAKGSQGEH
ncbi:MAG: hypothetical protein ACYCY2_00315 [Acidithiobacillus ferriphilus]